MHPERMSRITMLCRDEHVPAVIDTLAQLKVLHVTDHTKEAVGNATIDIGTPLPSARELSSALTALRSLLHKIGHSPAAPHTTSNLAVLERMARVQELCQAYAQHEQELGDVQAQLRVLALQKEILELLLLLESPIETIFKAKSVELIVTRETKQSDPAIIAKLKLLVISRGNAVLMTVRKEDAQQSRETLTAAGFMLVDLAPLAHLTGTPVAVKQELHHEHRLLQSQKQHLEQALESFAAHATFLCQSEPVLALALLKMQAPLHFGKTRTVTLIRGFVPQHSIKPMQEELADVAIMDFAAADDAPVLLQNPRVVNNFESLLRLYSLPKYNEIDPTRLVALSFPVFFGFMLGDVGYGVCALLAAFMLYRAIPKAKGFASIFMVSAISSIVFGFVFGEFFGVSQLFGLHLTPLIERADVSNIRFLFSIALSIALIHINLGLLLGVFNSKDGLFFSIVQKGSWVFVQIGFICLAASFQVLEKLTIFSFSIPWITGVTILLAAAFGLWYTEKEKGIIRYRGILEMLGMISNIVSYTRLVAIGLASVYLAFVINQGAGGMFTKGGYWIIAGVLLLLIGHAFNLLLGLMGPFLHALRLHYVEFFTKFYEGGGKPYVPFGTLEGTS